jgi:energy-coupling factor transporter ATP-binding protein EcfA2
LAFQFLAGESAERLVAQLAAAKWCGEIVGPHGSGKSTLLETLKPCLAAAGRSVSAVTLRDRQRRLPKSFLRESLASSRPLIIVDGYEQLDWPSRLLLRWRCRRGSAGLVVASHAATGLPLLYRTRPTLQIAEQLVSTLTARNPSPITATDVAASHACHGSNLRELLFALYDRHEGLVGTARTTAASPA